MIETMINELEQRRLRARAHDQAQRDFAAAAAADAAKLPSPQLQPRTVSEHDPVDRLAELLVKDGKSLATVDDLRAVFFHIEARLDEIDADFIDENP